MSILAKLVSIEAVQAEMAGRQPQLLQDGGKYSGLCLTLLNQRAAEVASVCGDPPPKDFEELAITCVVLGTAMAIESAIYPAQLNQDNARGEQLRLRYLGVLADLRRKVGGDAFTISTLPPQPVVPPWWAYWA